MHPKLDADSTLGTTAEVKPRGEIRDRRGRPLMTERPVVRVGAIAGKVKDPRATARGLAEVLDVDAAPLERAIRGGGRQQFVDALTLREPEFRRLRPAVKAVPDTATADSTAALAPSREFGRALLGSVAPVTKEQVGRSRGRLAPGDVVGQWGLQARFDKQLAGVPARRVVIRVNGTPVETLLTRGGKAGSALRTRLDADVQAAAESALRGQNAEAALVAVDPATGDILAVANRPVDSTYNRALAGSYAPGSTFKVISTAALLRDGLNVNQTVPCPPRATAGGRSFKNFEGGTEGGVPFARDFAISCNTAFVALASRLDANALQETARDYGLGLKTRIGVPLAGSQVPPGRDAVQRAAAMIGQHEILASPLTMAGVAATVGAGRWRSPRLLESDRSAEGDPLPSGEAEELRSLMRSVVTEGSGTALSGVSGGVIGKSGTAEFGSGDPPPTHAWFIAQRGRVAVAVLVERGRSGGTVAAPIAARFFDALDG